MVAPKALPGTGDHRRIGQRRNSKLEACCGGTTHTQFHPPHGKDASRRRRGYRGRATKRRGTFRFGKRTLPVGCAYRRASRSLKSLESLKSFRPLQTTGTLHAHLAHPVPSESLVARSACLVGGDDPQELPRSCGQFAEIFAGVVVFCSDAHALTTSHGQHLRLVPSARRRRPVRRVGRLSLLRDGGDDCLRLYRAGKTTNRLSRAHARPSSTSRRPRTVSRPRTIS